MKTLEFDYDTETGFAWILVDTNNADGSWSVQCCLKAGEYNEESATQSYLKEIDMGDCGHDDGICGDGNKEAFDYWGENRCMTALFAAAKENDIELA